MHHMQILDDVIRYKWSVLPSDEREGMKNYISNIIIKLSSDETTFKNERHFINKLNTILVQVLKHEWPHNWPSFIHDLVGAARNSETLCENCMYILRVRVIKENTVIWMCLSFITKVHTETWTCFAAWSIFLFPSC